MTSTEYHDTKAGNHNPVKSEVALDGRQKHRVIKAAELTKDGLSGSMM